MAVLQKMREKFGIAISVIIALSLLYFIAPMDDLMTLFGRPQNVGEINGRGISYEDFAADVERFTTINEIMTGSSAKNEEQQKQVRDAAWQSLLDKYMFIDNARKAGISVGDDEVVDLISQSGLFTGDNGEFSVEKLRDLIDQAETDPTAALYWEYLRTALRTQRYYEKYSSLFTASSVDNALTLADAVAENNTTVDAQFISLPYGYARDTTINVSNAEIKSYYKAHKNIYRQDASRDLEYVVFEVVPSASDIAAANNEMAKAVAEFRKAPNLKTFLLKNSERQLSDYWYKKGELNSISSKINDHIFSNASGVSEIVKEGDTFYAAKTVATAQVPDSVYVKHILLQGDDAGKTADSLLRAIRKNPASFETNVALYSADKGSSADGKLGNIGWLTQTYMIPGFESVITAEKNAPFILETQYGTHVVVVTKTTKPVLKKRVAILEKTVLASKETFQTYYSQANRFASITAGTVEGYKKAVDSLGIYSHKMNNVKEGNDRYGSVDQAKEVTRWAYETKKAGKASGILTVNNNYFFVVALNGIHKEGYKPVSEVSSQISNTLYSKKLGEKKVAEFKAAAEGAATLEEVAQKLDATVESKTGITFSAMSAPEYEPALMGALLVAPEGELYGPVKGGNAAYYCKVGSRNVGSFYTEDDAKGLASQKAQYNSQMIIPVMMEAAGVKDNRARYY